jgi:hypothetical protein
MLSGQKPYNIALGCTIMAKISIGKLEAAERQFDAAIHLLLQRGDPIAVHTIVGAASNIVKDLVDSNDQARTWERLIALDNGLSYGDYLKIANRVQNFLKHADRDPTETLEFNSDDTEYILWVSSLNLGEIYSGEKKLSVQMAVFQIWFISTHQTEWHFTDDNFGETIKAANKFFPDILTKPRQEQLNMGLKVLEEEISKRAA